MLLFLKTAKQYIYPGDKQRLLLNVSLWWRHNIYLWRHNGVRRHARAKHYEYFIGKLHPNRSWTLIQETFCIAIPLYLVKQFRIESSDIYQILIYFHNFDIYFINRYLTVRGLPLCSHRSHCLKRCKIFHSFVDSCIGTICHHKYFTGRVLLSENFISPQNNLFHIQKCLFWRCSDPRMGPICSEWYSQSDRRKIPEPSWSVLAT